MRYPALSLLGQGLSGHRGWRPARRKATPAPACDALIVGGGGHGLATAYYLAHNHGLARVAVLEKGWIGGGNTGRNTTAVRSNHFWPERVALHDLALRLYEGLARELNFNVMLSQRGMPIAAHAPRADGDLRPHRERDEAQRGGWGADVGRVGFPPRPAPEQEGGCAVFLHGRDLAGARRDRAP